MTGDVITYHCQIPVEGGKQIEVDLPDFEVDKVVLKDLASELGVGTVGEVVQKLEKSKKHVAKVGIGCRKGCKVWKLTDQV